MTKKSKRRIPAVFTRKMSEKTMVYFLILLLMMFGLSIVILRLNEAKGDEYTVKVLAQNNYSSTVLPFKRGDILDRNGVTLATSIKVYNLILDPKLILEDEKYIEPTLEALNSCFGYDKEELRQLIQNNNKRSYLVYQKQLSYEEIKAFLAISDDKDNNPYVKGVTFESEYQRKYPFSRLASHVIGFTVSGNVGNWGIEEQYNEYLNGVDGREYGYVNSDNIMEKITKEATDGDTVISTIDFNIQTIIEKYIAQWKEQYHPDNMGVLVMNPKNGEVLAMAGDLNYDLNNPRQLEGIATQEQIDTIPVLGDNPTEEEKQAKTNAELAVYNAIWRNYCISDTFEPGSTFKPVTVAIALEQGLISGDMTFLCDGGEQYPGNYIKCHKTSGHGVITAAQGLAFSCNDAMMQIGRLEGIMMFSNYIRKFGFGTKTGIDLPGESSCDKLMYEPDTMTDTDLAISSFGQGSNVTMIQLASAFTSIINGGYYYEPHVVKQIVKSNGSIVKNVEAAPVKQTVTKATSDYIKTGLRVCVDYGTGKSAAVPGYLISGKTGTAQKSPRKDKKYLLSFIGFAPYDDPEVVCYVVMDNPSDDTSTVTGSLFSAIMSEVLPYLNVAQDNPESAQQPDDSTQTTEPAQQPDNSTQASAEQASAEQATQEETTVSNIGEPEVAGDNLDNELTGLTEPE